MDKLFLCFHHIALIASFFTRNLLGIQKERYSFIQHLVINAFPSGLQIILSIVFLPLLFLFDKESGLTILTIPDLIGAGFSILALYQFFDNIPKKQEYGKYYYLIFIWD